MRKLTHGWTIGEKLAPNDRMHQILPLLHFELGLFHLTYRFSRFITCEALITSVLFADSRSVLYTVGKNIGINMIAPQGDEENGATLVNYARSRSKTSQHCHQK